MSEATDVKGVQPLNTSVCVQKIDEHWISCDSDWPLLYIMGVHRMTKEISRHVNGARGSNLLGS